MKKKRRLKHVVLILIVVLLVIVVIAIGAISPSKNKKSDQNIIRAESLFQELIDDSFVGEEYIDASSRLTNAILKNISFQIVQADTDSFRVSIEYPEVSDMLIAEAQKLPDDFGEAEADAVYDTLTLAVQNGKTPRQNEVLQLSVVEDDGVGYIILTAEALRALTGGLSEIR